MGEPHQHSRWAAAERADPPSTYPTLTGQSAPSNKQPRVAPGDSFARGRHSRWFAGPRRSPDGVTSRQRHRVPVRSGDGDGDGDGARMLP
jgi:hypothetical protein